jgi:hypothetical protein
MAKLSSRDQFLSSLQGTSRPTVVRSALLGAAASFYVRSKPLRKLPLPDFLSFAQNYSRKCGVSITIHEADQELQTLIDDALIGLDDGHICLTRIGRGFVFRGKKHAVPGIDFDVADHLREIIRDDAVVKGLPGLAVRPFDHRLSEPLVVESSPHLESILASADILGEVNILHATDKEINLDTFELAAGNNELATPGQRAIEPISEEPAEKSDDIIGEAAAADGTDPVVASDQRTSEPISEQPAEKTSVFSLIDVPAIMRANETVEIKVGITKQARPNVTGSEIKVPSRLPYTLTVLLSASSFSLGLGESFKNTLEATVENPFPQVTLHLTPLGLAEGSEIEQRGITVTYLMESQVVGFGGVVVSVIASNTDRSAIPSEPPLAAAVMTSVETTQTPDLTIAIWYADSSRRDLEWLFISPHMPLPKKPDRSIITNAESFARTIAEQFTSPSSVGEEVLRGTADTVNRALPSSFDLTWEQFQRNVPKGKIPTVLILSEEPYVPWELAEVPAVFDPEAAPILGAQAQVGRWILNARNRPPMPPRHRSLKTAPMVAVSARYRSRTWPRLPYAEAEVAALERGGAKLIDPTARAICDCIRGSKDSPEALILHVALHGVYADAKPVRGLIMGDEEPLTEIAVTGCTARDAPFVFLNACQVGNGSEMLGQYSGLAAAFLYSGARGVIAPLWNVNDAVAKDFALSFYEAVRNGVAPSEFLRTRRKSLTGTDASTNLAYVFFGDPGLRADLLSPDN